MKNTVKIRRKATLIMKERFDERCRIAAHRGEKWEAVKPQAATSRGASRGALPARSTYATTLIRLPHSRGLQPNNRPFDPKPHELSVAVAAFKHLIGSPGCNDLGVGFMFADQQIGGTPDVAIGDHSGSSRSADFPTLGDLDLAVT
jgi:hypothetical protein